jgi:hypothetical protein
MKSSLNLSIALRGALAALTLVPVGAWAGESQPKPAVVASVNGKELTEAEFRRRCEHFVGGGADTAVGLLVLREWLQHTIVEEEAVKKKLVPTPQEVDVRVRAVRKQFEFRGQNFNEWLDSHGRTLEMLREDLRQQMLVENLLTEGVKVSDAEAGLYYATNKQVFGLPEQIRISRITVGTREAARIVDAALKTTPFNEVASKHSQDQFKSEAGKVPDPIDADPKTNGPLEKELLEKVVKLEVGKYVGPIKLDRVREAGVEEYWSFVRLDERLPARAPDLLDVQDLIMANLKIQKAGPERLKAAQDRLTQLQRDAKVEIFRTQYRSLLKHFGPRSAGQ